MGITYVNERVLVIHSFAIGKKSQEVFEFLVHFLISITAPTHPNPTFKII